MQPLTYAPLPLPTPTPLTHRQRIAWRVAIGAIVAYTLTLFVPWAPAMPSVELDASWYMVLHWAFLRGMDFGHQIVFTYGPWGFLFQGYHPSTFIYSVITWVLIAITCFMVMHTVVNRLTAKRWLQALMMVGFMAMIGTSLRGLHDIRLLVTCWGLLVLHFYVDDRPLNGLKVAMVLALAIISMGKFSLAIIAFLVILLISIDLLSRKIVPGVLYIYLGAVVVLWLAAGQSPFSVIVYLRNSMLITSGFSAGVAKDSPHEVRDVVMFFLCALMLLGTIALIHVGMFRRARASATMWKEPAVINAGLRMVLLVGALAMVLLMLFKMGYVRHDEHELLATNGMGALAVMYLAVLWPAALSPFERRALITAASACLLLMAISFQVWIAPWGLAGQIVQTFTRFPVRTWEAAGSVVGANRKMYDEMLAEYRRFRPLPEVQGGVDAVSWFQYSLLAHDLEYHPRPVIQGYLAYTPDLARRNAEFFQSDHAPESVLFDMQSIDGYPSTGEATVLPELLGRYELVSADKGALHLRLPQRPRKYTRTVLQTTTAKLGETIRVPPSGEPVWVSLKLTPTLRGKLASMLYKPPPVYLNLKSGDDAPVVRTRIVPGIASEGFLLSPMILDRMTFAILYSDQWKELLNKLMVTEIQVVVGESGDSTYAYAPEFEVTFEELRFEHGDIMSVPGILEYFRFEQFVQQVQPLSENAQKLGTKNEEWTPVLLSPAPMQWMVEVPPSVVGFRVNFGMLRDSYSRDLKTDGVEFRVYAANVQEGGQIEATPLMVRRLDPATIPSDRGLQSEQIQLPSPLPRHLVLETIPGPTDTLDQSYWGGVLFLRQE